MVRLAVRFNLNDLKRDLDAKGRKRVDKAAAIALGRVATTVRKVASQGIREKLAIKAAVAKNAITIRRLQGKLTIFIEASGKPIPIRDYGARQGKRGVTYRVSKAKGRRVYQNKFGKGFALDKAGGNVFIRVQAEPKGPRRAKIVKAYGPSIPQYFVTRIIRQLLQAKARERWPIEFAAAWRGLNIRAGRSA